MNNATFFIGLFHFNLGLIDKPYNRIWISNEKDICLETRIQ